MATLGRREDLGCPSALGQWGGDQNNPVALKRTGSDDAPLPIGEYVQAISVPTPGSLLFVSGQIGTDSAGNVSDVPTEECRQAWRNVLSQLDAAGYAPVDLVKVTVFLTSRDDLHPHQEARNEVLGPTQPTRSVVVASGLADPNWHIEVEATDATQSVS